MPIGSSKGHPTQNDHFEQVLVAGVNPHIGVVEMKSRFNPTQRKQSSVIRKISLLSDLKSEGFENAIQNITSDNERSYITKFQYASEKALNEELERLQAELKEIVPSGRYF